MSKIYNANRTSEKEFTANKLLDDARNKAVPTSDMAFVQLTLGVLGNKLGKLKSSGEAAGISTGGSFRAGFGSDYCTADMTYPFTWEYGKANQEKIGEQIAIIQTKLSKALTRIQGPLPDAVNKQLRDSALRTQAIREAKEEITNETESIFDQRTFDAANRQVRANVISDMSLSGSVRCTFAIPADSERAQWAVSKGYREVPGKNIYTIGADEKGLKKVYLLGPQVIGRAYDYVYNIGSQVQDAVDKAVQTPWTNEVSMALLTALADIIPEETGDVKQIDGLSADEIGKVREFKKIIIEEYWRIMNE